MIAAAAAAMIGGVQAALPDATDTIIDAEVGVMHSLSITVKTLMPTVYDSTKTKGCAICPTTVGGKCYLFEQGSLTVNGIFASCGCEDPFAYGYFWLGSGKKAVKLLDRLPADATEYTDLPDLSGALSVVRYSKTNKKAAAVLAFDDGADVYIEGVGNGTYTEAKYSYNKTDDVYTIKTPAKASVSGSVVGSIAVEKLIAYKGVEDAEYVVFPVADACTIDQDCDEGDELTAVPFYGTFAVKPTSVKALNKVIPADCWEK